MLAKYYQLAKPGIVYANVITALAGYLFASAWVVVWPTLLSLVVGIGLVIAGACVYNNVLDRSIDERMQRTKKRSLVTGDISVRAALSYASGLTIVGFALLLTWTNWLVVLLGLIALVDYVVAYGWAKRHTPYSTLIGSISGSASIVAGYAASSGRLDVAAGLLFALLTTWQMPHFYAIGLYRRADYAKAHLPVLPVVRSSQVVRQRMLAYIMLFTISGACFGIYGGAGFVSSAVLVGLGAGWLVLAMRDYRLDDVAWGKRVFLLSLFVNIGISLAVSVGSLIR